MKKAWFIGLNTFKESLRKKTLYILLVVALVVIGASKAFSFLTAEEELKMIKDVSFSGIEFFGALIAIFISLTAISNEIEKRTIYTLFSKPITRQNFFIGKFFGTILILLLNFILMSLFFIGLLIFKKSPPDIQVFKTLLLIFIELILIASITLTVATFASDAFNVIFSFFLYIVGHLTSYGNQLADRTENVILKGLWKILHTVVPNYENFNIRDKVVVGIDVSWQYIFKTGIYGILYLAVVLLIGSYFIQKREI
ncbi:MAG: ABC transporter permease subunit [Candidatus Omnitrophica bacterium]|nr:ABC transporter permease subunit [Candidatus Omnitrophota bacterium]MCM8801853.1 ABC transporter permease subunit [Candidatus Omnitrophota bacterium]